jgi:hypothetical protein
MASTKINWNNRQSKISRYFSVSEVTQNDSRRSPPGGSDIEREILRLASWYRPSVVNRAVGGSSNSQHLYGRAVDIRPANPGSLAKFQAWLDQHWYGALGYGARRGFVHLDTRNGKGWKTGGQKGPRWNY